jgi:hypothetical protein
MSVDVREFSSLPGVLEHTIHLASGDPLANAFSETYSRMAAGLGLP